ncbi:MAG: hypothetical protein ACR2JE_03100 [Acidobacteriaceae bacterium]
MLMLAQAGPAMAAAPQGFQFAGHWGCTGSFRSNKIHRSAFDGAMVLGGKWLELDEQDIEPATGYVARYLIGYDPQQKRLVEFDANNFGAATYSSPTGWQGGALTMTSLVSEDPKAPYVANRFRYSIGGPDTFTVDWEISKTSAMTWSLADHLVCKRQGAH